jgi:hypothetical protein
VFLELIKQADDVQTTIPDIIDYMAGRKAGWSSKLGYRRSSTDPAVEIWSPRSAASIRTLQHLPGRAYLTRRRAED